MTFVIAVMNLAPGSAEDVKKAAEPLLEATRKENGCISYDLYQSVSDPDQMTFVEEWESRAAIDAHMKQPHVLKWREVGAQYVQKRVLRIIEADSIEIL
jgi:quinol monooxygenase YgiN